MKPTVLDRRHPADMQTLTLRGSPSSLSLVEHGTDP